MWKVRSACEDIPLSSRKASFKDLGDPGDRDYMVAVHALVTAITLTLVLMAARLCVELDALEQD